MDYSLLHNKLSQNLVVNSNNKHHALWFPWARIWEQLRWRSGTFVILQSTVSQNYSHLKLGVIGAIGTTCKVDHSHSWQLVLVFGRKPQFLSLKKKKICLFLAVLGFRCWAGFFCSCREWRLLSRCDAVASHSGDLSCGAWTLECAGFRSCGIWIQQLWLWGLVAPSYVGSSWTRDWNCVFCFGRWILYHWAPREAPRFLSMCILHQDCLSVLMM